MQENAKHYHEQEDCHLPNAQPNFLTRSCCKEHGAMDKRTPGLFKIEWKGTEMISTAKPIAHSTKTTKR